MTAVRGKSAAFIPWGKKNQQAITARLKKAIKRKYFFIHCFLLNKKGAAIRCVGKAHNKLKLFFAIACSVPNHINTSNAPIRPIMKKKRISKTLRRIAPGISKLITAIKSNRIDEATSGVKDGFVFLI